MLRLPKTFAATPGGLSARLLFCAAPHQLPRGKLAASRIVHDYSNMSITRIGAGKAWRSNPVHIQPNVEFF